MADLKISALPLASTPLAGTEVLPIVQGGITEQVSVANLTAGRNIATNSVTANATLAPWSWPDGSSGVVQTQALAALSGYNGTTYLSQNYYYNGGEKFIANGWAHRLVMGGGSVTVATSTASNAGGAGAALTWNNVGVWDSSGNFTILGATATKASGTTWANPSDERLKTNVQDYTKGLQELMQLRFVTGEYNGLGGTPKGTKFISVIAQEAQQVLPDTISTFSAKLNKEDDVEMEFLKYDSSETQILVAVSVQQLFKDFEKLKQEFDVYKASHP